MDYKITKKQLREFGLIIGIFFPLFIGFIIPFLWSHQFKSWTIWVGIPFLVLALLSPNKLYYFYKFWIKIGYVLGFINSRIILGFIYIIVLLPISLIMRLFGYNPLRIKKTIESTYREKNNLHKRDLEKIF